MDKPETPSRWLAATNSTDWAAEILDQLVKHGQVSMFAVKAALKAAHAEFDREHGDGEEGVAS